MFRDLVSMPKVLDFTLFVFRVFVSMPKVLVFYWALLACLLIL